MGFEVGEGLIMPVLCADVQFFPQGARARMTISRGGLTG